MYQVTGRESLTARGKLHLLATEFAAAPTPAFQDLFTRCLLCGACESVCPRGIPVRELVVAARSHFPVLYGQHGLRKAAARFALARPALLSGLIQCGILLRNLALLPPDSGLRRTLGLLHHGSKGDQQCSALEEVAVPAGTSAGTSQIHYFAGCLARHLQPEVARATGRLVRGLAGISPVQPPSQACCGLAAWSAGALAEARRLAQRNILAFAEGSGPILTSCASCSAHLLKYPELFADDPHWRARAEQFSARVREFSTFVMESLGRVTLASPAPLRLYYHQPCHLRFDPLRAGAAVQLLGRVAGVSLLAPPAGAKCCGQGGLFHLGYPELAEQIFAEAFAACNETDAGLLVTSCTGCLLQWQAGLARRRNPLAAVHLAVFLAGCLDINS